MNPGQLKLSSFKIPLLPMVVQQAWQVPVWQEGEPLVAMPETVAELAELSGYPVDEISARLKKLEKLSQNLAVTPSALQTWQGRENVLILDLRPAALRLQKPYAGAVALHEVLWDEVYPQMLAANRVVVFAETEAVAVSAALFLRERFGLGAYYISSPHG